MLVVGVVAASCYCCPLSPLPSIKTVSPLPPPLAMVALLALKHGYMMLNDHFKLIQGHLDVYLKWANLVFIIVHE